MLCCLFCISYIIHLCCSNERSCSFSLKLSSAFLTSNSCSDFSFRNSIDSLPPVLIFSSSVPPDFVTGRSCFGFTEAFHSFLSYRLCFDFIFCGFGLLGFCSFCRQRIFQRANVFKSLLTFGNGLYINSRRIFLLAKFTLELFFDELESFS